MTVIVETIRRHEVMDIHLSDENASRERAFCRPTISTDDR